MVNEQARQRVSNSLIRNLQNAEQVRDIERISENTLDLKMEKLPTSNVKGFAEKLIYTHNPYLYNTDEYCVSILEATPRRDLTLRVRFGITPFKADAYLR